VQNSFTVFGNGNNIRIVGDQIRRTLRCRLDPNTENPEYRIFNTNPIAAVQADRGRYVAAILTIAKAYIAAGKPGRLPPLSSYDAWSDLVRSAIVWLGCADPVGTMATAAANDPQRQNRAAVFAAWAAELGLAPAQFLTKELIAKADEMVPGVYPTKRVRPMLRDALIDVARDRSGQAIDNTQLGKWLGSNEDTICAGYKLTVDRSNKVRPRWLLSKV
jgi:putative DNA primase/helicase